MSVYSAKVKNGVRYANYRCGANQTKGPSACTNDAQTSERKLRDGLLGALKAVLSRPAIIRRFVEKFTAHVVSAKPDTALTDTQTQVIECERTVANLSDAVARMGFSEALATRLSGEENRLRLLRAKVAELEASARRGRTAPHPVLIQTYLEELGRNLEADAAGMIRRHVGHITLTPKDKGPERFYEATGALRLFLPLGASVSESTSCGGAQAAFSETWFPLEVVLPSGRAAAGAP